MKTLHVYVLISFTRGPRDSCSSFNVPRKVLPPLGDFAKLVRDSPSVTVELSDEEWGAFPPKGVSRRKGKLPAGMPEKLLSIQENALHPNRKYVGKISLFLYMDRK